MHRDTRPTFTETPGRYTGPVPMVTHVHGAVGVGDDSDGYAEAWYLPGWRTTSRPATPTEGTWYDFFAGKAAAELRRHLGTRLRHLPVSEREPRFDHLVSRPHTRHDAAQRLRRAGGLLHHPRRPSRRRRRARHPHRHAGCSARARRPRRATNSRRTRPITRSPSRSRIARSTPTVRSSTRTRERSSTASSGPFIPDGHGSFSPIWNPEFFGNTIMVNGNTWPFQTVEKRRYRFRFLNGCQSRVPDPGLRQHSRCRGLADRQ